MNNDSYIKGVHYKFLATKKKKISRVVLNKPKKTFEVRQNRMIQKKEEKRENEQTDKFSFQK
jgi:hypothetical protein